MSAACTGTHAAPTAGTVDPGAGAAGGPAHEAIPAAGAPNAGAAGPAGSGGAPAAQQPAGRGAGAGAAGEPAPEDEEPSGGGCPVTFTALESIDADTPFGYRAADILAFAAGTHATAIRWQPIESRVFSATYTPESGEHGLTVGVRYAGGEVRVVRREPDPNTFLEPGLGCGSGGEWLEIDVELEVTSDAGALAEQRGTTLIVHNELWATIAAAGPERETTCTRIAADEFGGSFEVAVSEPEDYALRDACLELYLSPAGVVGQLWGTLEEQTVDPEYGAGTGEVEFAWIGAAGCDRVGGAPIDLDEDAFGISGRSVLEVIASVPSVDGTWQDGSSSEFTLAVEHGDGPACREVRRIGGWVQLESRLRIESADGRIDATWPIDVLMEPDDAGALSEVLVMLPEGLAFDQLGIAGVDTSGYELVVALAGLAFAPAPEGAQVAGGLEINGLAQVECPLPPPGAPPCPEAVLLDSLTWTNE